MLGLLMIYNLLLMLVLVIFIYVIGEKNTHILTILLLILFINNHWLILIHGPIQQVFQVPIINKSLSTPPIQQEEKLRNLFHLQPVHQLVPVLANRYLKAYRHL